MFKIIFIFIQIAFAFKKDQSDSRMVIINKHNISKAAMNKLCKEHDTTYSKHKYGVDGLELDCKNSAGEKMPFLVEGSDLEHLRWLEWNMKCTDKFGAEYKYAGLVEDVMDPKKPITTLLCNKATSVPLSIKSDTGAIQKLLDSAEKFQPNGNQK